MVRPILFSFLALATLGCGRGCPDFDSPSHIEFRHHERLTVRIADTPDERRQGLMGIETLPADEGMVFLYMEPTATAFWMKDTLIPLSIAFVDDKNRIVTIREMSPCSAEPCPTYASGAPYVYAIEANSGWYSQHGIEVGDVIKSFSGPFCA